MGQILFIADNRQRLVKLTTRLCTKHDAQSSDRADRVFRYASREDLSVFCCLCSLERHSKSLVSFALSFCRSWMSVIRKK